jgi:hypothetical protein
MDTTHSLFDTSRSPIEATCSPISSVLSSIVVGVAPYVTGWQVVQLFHHVDIGGFLHLPLECRKRAPCCTPVIPRATTHMATYSIFCLVKNAFTQIPIIREQGGSIGERTEVF